MISLQTQAWSRASGEPAFCGTKQFSVRLQVCRGGLAAEEVPEGKIKPKRRKGCRSFTSREGARRAAYSMLMQPSPDRRCFRPDMH